MKRDDLALAVLTVGDCYALQLRDNKPGIEAPGMWGLFGGHLHAGEEPQDGMRREIVEELGFHPRGAQPLGYNGAHVFEAEVSDEWHSRRLSEGQGAALFTFAQLSGLVIDAGARKILEFHHYKHLRTRKRVVMCHGVFDVFHYGHVLYLMAARKLGDYLIISLVSDRLVKKGPGKPVFNEHERASLLRSIKIVDEVILTEEIGPHDHLRMVMPHVYCKGIEYKDALIETDTCREVGAEIAFIDQPKYSSSKILDGSMLAERAKK